jgi:SAM-dependent methyltransferase
VVDFKGGHFRQMIVLLFLGCHTDLSRTIARTLRDCDHWTQHDKQGEKPVTDDPQRSSVADRFNNMHAVRLRSAVLDRVHRTAFGDDYPEDTHMNGFYSLTTLEWLCVALRLGPGSTLADLGCGHGGTGLWISGRTGADLIGIDLSPIGVDLAREQANRLGLAGRARFQVGDLTTTGLPDASCDAVLSLDVLAFVPDKAAAAREFARVLRSGGLLGFTSWEQVGYSARLGAEQCADHRPLLDAAGFTIDTYGEPPEWQRHHRSLAEGLIAAEPEMSGEMEAAIAARWAAMGRGVLADMPVRRYVRVVAQKK